MPVIIQRLVEKFVLDLISKYVTPEIVCHYEQLALTFAVQKLVEFAKTTPTEMDDTVVAAVAKALGVKV